MTSSSSSQSQSSSSQRGNNNNNNNNKRHSNHNHNNRWFDFIINREGLQQQQQQQQQRQQKLLSTTTSSTSSSKRRTINDRRRTGRRIERENDTPINNTTNSFIASVSQSNSNNNKNKSNSKATLETSKKTSKKDQEKEGDDDDDELGAEIQKGEEVSPSIGETVVTIALDKETGYNEITIITLDRAGLMLDIGNALNSLGISVREVVMKAGADGFVESRFIATDMDLGPLAEKEWDRIKERLRVSCLRRGVSKPWRERESRLKELFQRIDSTATGSIGQDDLDKFAQSLRMPKAFVHEFISEASSRQDDDETGKVNFEEFAAFVRSKEIALKEAFNSLDTDEAGKISGKKMKQSLRTLTLRSGRNNTRKRIAKKGIENMCRYITDDAELNANDFRDMLVLIPSGQLETVTPYYMKVGLDIGSGLGGLPIPDKRKEGSPWGHLIAGGISGIVSRTVSSPLNVIAIRTAAASEATMAAAVSKGATLHAISNLSSSIASIAKKEGFRGFFKGNMANSLGSVPGKAIDFFAYDFYKKLLTNGDRDPENWERFAAGALAGMTSDTIMYPLDLISTRISLNQTRDMKNSLMQMVNVAKETGIRGCYAGWSAAMIGVIPYAGISFSAYDTFKSQYKKMRNIDDEESIGSGPTLMCGLCAGWLASTISYPLYYCTIRLQAGTIPRLANGRLPRLDQVIVNTIKQNPNGWRDLFRGYLPSSLKLMPQAGFSFLTYELVQQELEKRSKTLSRKLNFDDNDEEQRASKSAAAKAASAAAAKS